MIDLNTLTIKKAHEAMKNGDFSVTDLVKEYIAEIEKSNTKIHAYLEIYSDVLDQAKRAEEMFANGTATELTGIPIALKDNMLRQGFVSSSSSKIQENYVATYDSTVVRLLKEQGVVFLGRTNMDEFAMGSSTENSAYGPTLNPLDTERVPGGSSGGSVAAVAMNGALIALGSDTGGSIRQPASFCGLVGFKPTYGTVSRYGLTAMSSSLDQIGPIAKSVEDVEIIFDRIYKHDPMEATSYKDEDRIEQNTETKKIGVPRDWIEGEGLDEDIKKSFFDAVEEFKKNGYEIIDVDLPISKHSLAIYYIIQPAEVSSNMARFDGVRYGERKGGDNLQDLYGESRGQGLGDEVRRRILLGTFTLSHGHYDAYYAQAMKATELVKDEFKNIFTKCDAIITPTSPFAPFKFGEKTENPLSMYMSDLFTVPANIAGIPAISLPFGIDSKKMPIGIQLMGPNFSDRRLFKLGRILTKE